MQELLLGTWASQLITYTEQNPWRLFAAVLVGVLLLDLMLRNWRPSSAGEFDGFGFGDGDGGCGD